PDHRARRIGFVGFDGVSGLDLTGALEAFTLSLELSRGGNEIEPYEVVVVGLKRKSFMSESGVVFRTQTTIQSVAELDTIIIPGGHGIMKPRTVRELSSWLVPRAVETRRIAAICGGIYPLAHAGLLDGR